MALATVTLVVILSGAAWPAHAQGAGGHDSGTTTTSRLATTGTPQHREAAPADDVPKFHYRAVDRRFGVSGGVEFGGVVINHLLTWIFLGGLFALILVPPMGWWSVRTLDVALLLSFSVAHQLYAHRQLEAALYAAYLSLIALAVRLIWSVVGRGAGLTPPEAGAAQNYAGALAWLHRGLPTRALWAIAAVVGCGRYVLHAAQSTFTDVGIGGYEGAHRLLHGQHFYGALVGQSALRHFDTYLPLNYLLYVPATLLSPSGDVQGAMSSASLLADILCIIAIARVGIRLLGGRSTALLVAAWVTYPETTWTLMNNVNDAYAAAAVLVALAFLDVPFIRGLCLGVAGGIKLFALAAAGVFSWQDRRRIARECLLTALGMATAAAIALAVIAVYGDSVSTMLSRTIGFQLHRTERFSSYGLWTFWHIVPVERVAQVVVVLALVGLFALPRRGLRTTARASAAAFVLVAIVQPNWQFAYILWFAAPLLVALAAETAGDPSPEPGGRAATTSSGPTIHPR